MCDSFEKKALDIIKDCLKNENNGYKKYAIIKSNSDSNHKCAYTCYRICEDNYIGNVSSKASNLWAIPDLRYNNRGIIKEIPQKNVEKHIVLVLESPHRDEFLSQLTAPALGQTGKRIHEYLWKLLNDSQLLDDNESAVYLVNAVQYQCSLGFETNLYRDLIFKKMLSKEDLVARIQKCNPSIIIVASTVSTKKDILDILKDEPDFEGKIYCVSEHPSVWNDNTKISKL